MDYNEFLQTLKDGHVYPKHIYYALLIINSEHILLDTARTSQGVVAAKLGINHSTLSAVLNMLKMDLHLSPALLNEIEDYTHSLKL